MASYGAVPQLPRIDTGYDTPGSDYMSSFRGHSKIGAVDTGSITSSTLEKKRFQNSASSDGSFRLGSSHRKSGNRPSKQYSISSKRNDDNSSESSKRTSDEGNYLTVRDHTVPIVQKRRTSLADAKSLTDLCYSKISPLKKANSATYRRMSIKGSAKGINRWEPPRISSECYSESKEKCLSGGKFKQQMQKYFNEVKQWWEEKSDSDDDGYDTDLDKQLGM
jgi:hypothetical protein